MQEIVLRAGKAIEKLLAEESLSSGDLCHERGNQTHTLGRDKRILTKKAEQA